MSAGSTGISLSVEYFMIVKARVPKQNGSVRAGRPQGPNSAASASKRMAAATAQKTARIAERKLST